MRAKPASVKVDKRGLLSKKEFGKISAMHGEAKPGEQVLEIRNVAEQQCAAAGKWPEVKKINAWMISSETATFMKVGGLGVVATELPEAFNSHFLPKAIKFPLLLLFISAIPNIKNLPFVKIFIPVPKTVR